MASFHFAEFVLTTRFRVEVKRGLNHQWSWRVRAGNGEIIAWSGEQYVDKHHCLKMARILFPLFRIKGA